jgi:hypothetical protein
VAEILRFDTNVPVEVALRFSDGKHVEGRYGDQVMYSLGQRLLNEDLSDCDGKMRSICKCFCPRFG